MWRWPHVNCDLREIRKVRYLNGHSGDAGYYIHNIETWRAKKKSYDWKWYRSYIDSSSIAISNTRGYSHAFFVYNYETNFEFRDRMPHIYTVSRAATNWPFRGGGLSVGEGEAASSDIASTSMSGLSDRGPPAVSPEQPTVSLNGRFGNVVRKRQMFFCL